MKLNINYTKLVVLIIGVVATLLVDLWFKVYMKEVPEIFRGELIGATQVGIYCIFSGILNKDKN